MFLLVPAYPGCPGQTAVKWLLLLLSSAKHFTFKPRAAAPPPMEVAHFIASAPGRGEAYYTTLDVVLHGDCAGE